ncbi:hypothetical protein LWI28_007570 [Acer negundo]|uniref:Uncharacterized protein n=1 Tax=Acer negundo TaxID=4023 RepID=A0AAD5J9R0_ACENE|nr:hypothetical protein LWI28_007570 [Acer negundo]
MLNKRPGGNFLNHVLAQSVKVEGKSCTWLTVLHSGLPSGGQSFPALPSESGCGSFFSPFGLAGGWTILGGISIADFTSQGLRLTWWTGVVGDDPDTWVDVSYDPGYFKGDSLSYHSESDGFYGFGDRRTFFPSRRRSYSSFNYLNQVIHFGEDSNKSGLRVRMEFLSDRKKSTFSSGAGYPAELVAGYLVDLVTGYLSDAVAGYPIDLRDRILSRTPRWNIFRVIGIAGLYRCYSDGGVRVAFRGFTTNFSSDKEGPNEVEPRQVRLRSGYRKVSRVYDSQEGDRSQPGENQGHFRP